MTVEVLPVGTRCALECKHCYQAPIRDADNQASDVYDMKAMKRALEKENYKFTVFGGEPLLMPIDDLEDLWKWGKERFGQNSVQTSATCVKERHFELFKEYNVSVGISLEGPGELNDIRWAGSIERTRETTKLVESVLRRLLEERHPVSLITTLNRGNAAPGRLSVLLDWYRDLDRRGLRHVNLHLMEIDNETVREEWALSEEDNAGALLACADLQAELEKIRFQPIVDMAQLLLGNDSQICTWNACDPYTTRAVRSINGDGHRHNCLRANKAGVEMQKADHEFFVRPLALYHVAQEHGGCQDCRYWYACKAGCPGQAISGDWRRKTEHCKTLRLVFEVLEKRLATLGLRPISLDGNRRATIEKRLVKAFSSNKPFRLRDVAGAPPHADVAHGDHNDAQNPVITHGDTWNGQ